MTRALIATMVVATSCGVPPGPSLIPCNSATPCSAEMVCDVSGSGSYCAHICDPGRPLCEDGAACYERAGGGPRCVVVGTVPEGELLADNSCARGLLPVTDYSGEPVGRRCEPACNRDSDCRTGEVCQLGHCDRRCTIDSCPDGLFCIATIRETFCVNARRFARSDCDGDGLGDCAPYSMCDAVGECGPLAPGELP